MSELAGSVPISLKSFHSNNKVMLDKKSRQYLISVSIKVDENERIVKSVTDIIDTMVKNKTYTSILLGKSTQYLDQDYGFKPLRK